MRLTCEGHLHGNVLFLSLDLGPLILLLLELLGHLQVVLHQTALIDIGGQVALNCLHTHTHTLYYQ